MHIPLLPVRVSEATLASWFLLAPTPDEGAAERLRTELRERSDRIRVMLEDASGPVVGFVVETDAPGAVTWVPRLRAALAGPQRQQALRAAAAHAKQICQAASARFLECTLKGITDPEIAWRDAMLSEGFTCVARKCHYERDLSTSWQLRGGAPAFTAAEVDPSDERVEALFARTLQGSLDRSTVFEQHHGGGLGAADRVLIVAHQGQDIGLCALEHEAGAARGWIKYLGTIASARRGGVGQTLLGAGLASLEAHGAKLAECLIDSGNRPSIALHERHGFHATGTCGDSYYAALGLPD